MWLSLEKDENADSKGQISAFTLKRVFYNLKPLNMKNLIILILLFTACKKEKYTADNCPARNARYFYYNNNTTETCCAKSISPCDTKTIQEFKNNCPSGWIVKYAP